MDSRPSTQQNLSEKITSSKTINVIRQTRKIIKGMTEQQRFEKALNHVKDALYFRHPRPDAYNPNVSDLFKICYSWQNSYLWIWFLFISSYVYTYLIFLDPKTYFVSITVLQVIILVIYWMDVAMYLYHKSFQAIKISAKFQLRFYLKNAVLVLMVADLLIMTISEAQDIRYFRPFRFFRGLLPIFYDALTRKSFEAFFSAYKDIIIFVLLYACIILSWTLMANQFIQFPSDYAYDEYKQNYPSFIKTIYIIYTMSSYDAYPDNQLAAIRWSQWTNILFLPFVILNMFFFVVIPGTIIFKSYRQNRSKTMLIDQIRQQNSLILAFVSLGEENYHISSDTLIRFLLHMYRKKARYVNYITDICLKLDENNNGTIQISEFMQLAIILTKNSHMVPPQYDDFEPWIIFRQKVNQYLYLKKIVTSWAYKLMSNLIIILTFINCVSYISTAAYPFYILDTIFQVIFIIDIFLRITGIGFQNFFRDKWNHVDFIIVLIVLFVQILPADKVPHNSDVILKMFRIYRISTIVKLFRRQTKKGMANTRNMFGRLRKLLGQTAIVIPIVMKLFPLFFLILYYLGILGMELFYYAEQVPPTQEYGFYSQYSNFKSLLSSQYVLIQVLTQAGWSLIAFDYCVRTGIYFPVVLYFMMCHTTIVIILGALFKALIWQTYSAVQGQYLEKQFQQNLIIHKEQENQKKKQQFAQIREIIQQNGYIIPNTIIKRQFLENKLDIQIFKRLKELYIKKISNLKSNNKKRSGVIEQIVIAKKKYLMDDFSQNQSGQNQQTMNKLYEKIIRENLKEDELDVVQEEDFQEQMEQLMEKIILHPKTKYSQTIVYPKVLQQLLEDKMIRPYAAISEKGFNINKDILENRDSIKFHTYQLNVLLQIQRSQRDQKMEIIKYMTDNNLISQQEARSLFSKKGIQKLHHVNVNWVIRKMFLRQTNQQLIKKFQIQYFSDIYGQSFKQINKVTIQPLLRYQALLTYNFKNIMRYPQMPLNNFFEIFTTIEDKISNSLLKKGSLFKFVYQIQTFSDNWFTVQFKDMQEIRIHFIKTGIWIFNKTMMPGQIYYANDLFKWNLSQRGDRITCQKILKLLYQTFQGLAFGLLNEKNFFTSNPMEAIYDLYSFYLDVHQIQRIIQKKLQVSKIMLVILSKQEDRDDNQRLQYELTEIITQKEQKKNVDFKFDESQTQTFEKLKNLSVVDSEKIIQSQGLPYSYILNLMREMKDTLQLYSSTLVNQVQKILNEQFQKN